MTPIGSLSERSDSRPNDVEHVLPQTRVEIRAWEVVGQPVDFLGRPRNPLSRIYVSLQVDAMILEQASGATLGEAIFHLGALMVGERLTPTERIRPFLKPGTTEMDKSNREE